MSSIIEKLFIPSPAQNIEFASQYDLRELVLTLSGGTQQLDIRNLYTEFNIYEDMLGTCISGNITIYDTLNLLGNAALSGNEKLRIVVDTPTKNKPIEVEFVIYNISPVINDASQNSVRAQTYVINFCSKEKILDSAVIVQKSYKSSLISDMVMDIMFSYLGTDKTVFVEQTASPQDIIVPGFHPLKAVDWLSTRAVSTNQNPAFVFFENRYGYYFQSLETLASMAPTDVPTYILTTKGAEIDQGMPDIDRRMRSIKDFQFIGTPDSLHQTKEGIFASTLQTYDPIRMKFTEIPYDIVSGISRFAGVNLGQLPAFVPGSGLNLFANSKRYFATTNYNRSQTPYGSTHDPALNNSNIEMFQGRRQSILGQAETFKIRMLVNGDVGLTAGTVIDINYPSLDRRTALDVNNLDSTYSGRYLITAVRHKFAIKTHMTVLEVVKGTVGKGLGRT